MLDAYYHITFYHIILTGRARCSHFMSICYLATATMKHAKFMGVPCPNGCVNISGPKRLPVNGKINPFEFVSLLRDYKIGNDAPDEWVHSTYHNLFKFNRHFQYIFSARGCICIDVPYAKHCPFVEA